MKNLSSHPQEGAVLSNNETEDDLIDVNIQYKDSGVLTVTLII